MKEHIDIFINGKKIKVLNNYRYKEIEGEKAITFKTQIKGQDFVIDPHVDVEIMIDREVISNNAKYEGTVTYPTFEEWIYKI